MTNIAIFVSGNGTNCENIIRYFQNSDIARVSLVISNKADAYALTRAKNLNVPSMVASKSQFNDEKFLLPILKEYNIDFIVLAGFLLMVPSYLINEYDHKMINIHPAILKKYGGKGMYGHHIHEAVKAAGEKETGITIHYVNEICDGGEIIKQYSTPIAPEDTVEDIEEKVHVLEQTYFPSVIEAAIIKQQ